MKENKRVIQWLAILLVGLFTFLSVMEAIPIGLGEGVISAEASGRFDNSELTSVLPSAYFETKNSLTSDGDKFNENSRQFEKNIRKIADNHFGNVGLFVGFPGDSDSQLSALNTSNALSTSESNNQFNAADVKRYYTFGAAVQNLSKKGIKSDKIEESSQRTVESISMVAKSLIKVGAKLVRDYDPTPLIMSMYLTEGETNTNQWVRGMPRHINLANEASNNKLVDIVMRNKVLSGILDTIRISPTGNGRFTLFSWIVFIMVILLVASGALMQVFNGRAAGENYRKAIVKIVVSTLAVPLVATLLHYGVTTFVDVAEPDITPQEDYAEQAIGQHLNFADWYATGFAVPDGLELTIKNERFVLSQEQIRAINRYTYVMIVGNPEYAAQPTDEMVYRRLLNAGDQNYAQPSFVEKSGWDGMTVKKAGDEIVKNDGEVDIELGRFESTKGSYLGGYRNTMTYPREDGNSTVASSTANGDGSESRFYGMSPLASYNMMRSTFSGGNITSSLAKPQMASVVYSAFVGSDGGEMNGVTKLVATYVLVMAAMKGLASIFTAGLGAVFAGSVSGGLGSSAGLGQAVGGVIALVGGVIGMGVIMNLSFALLNELHFLFEELFTDTVAGDPNMLQPLRDAAEGMGFPLSILKPLILGALHSLSSVAVTVASMIALPKFGKIPINLFAQKMSELPSNFAERAQRMENRFTGDYRAGGIGGGSMSSSVNSQMSQIMSETKSQGLGIGEAAVATAGLAAGGAGMAMESLGDIIAGDKNEGNSSMTGGNEEDINSVTTGDEEYDGEETSNIDSFVGDQNEESMAVSGDNLGDGDGKGVIERSKTEKDTEAGEKDSLVTGLGAQEISKNEHKDGDTTTAEGNQSSKDTIDQSELDASKKDAINTDLYTGSEHVTESNLDASKEDAINTDLHTGSEHVTESNLDTSNEKSVNTSQSTARDETLSQNINSGKVQEINTDASNMKAQTLEDTSVGAQNLQNKNDSNVKMSENAQTVVGGSHTSVGEGEKSVEKGNLGESQAKVNTATKGTESIAKGEDSQQAKEAPIVSKDLKEGRPAKANSDSMNSPTPPEKETTNTSKPESKVTPTQSKFRLSMGKALQTGGRTLRAAGGEPSVKRAAKIAKHAAASTVIGGAAQQKTQAELNDVLGKINVERPNPKVQGSNQANTKSTNTNSRSEGRILRQEEEQERREEVRRR